MGMRSYIKWEIGPNLWLQKNHHSGVMVSHRCLYPQIPTISAFLHKLNLFIQWDDGKYSVSQI